MMPQSPSLDAQSPASAAKRGPRSATWWYLEFGGYVAFAVYVINSCFWMLLDISERHHETLKKHLRPPWGVFAGRSRGIDQADIQWRDVSNNFPLLGLAMLGFVLLSAQVRKRTSPQGLLNFYVAAGLVFTIYLHGAGVVFMFTILAANFVFSRWHSVVPYWAFMALMWTSQIALLFANDHFKGYSFSTIAPALAFLDAPKSQGSLRWYVLFNFSTLRMIAFNYDYYESCSISSGAVAAEAFRDKLRAKHANCLECVRYDAPCYKLRTDVPAPPSSYSFKAYLAYMLYVPLYIAGPLTSFNAFLSHANSPQRWFRWSREAPMYAARIAVLWMCQAFLLHFNHVNALRRYPLIVLQLSREELAAYGLFTLAFLWMKFSVLWKTMRLFAMMDGVEVPENMNRCFCNSLAVTYFWRDWHASFNAWIVRYMYVPLGGNKRKALIIFPVFGFIALWHDIKMQLFVWAFIMAIAMVPELVVMSQIAAPRWDWLRQKPYYRILKALGGSFSVLTLIAANLIGYGIGSSETGKGVTAIVSLESARFVALVMFSMYVAASISLAERTAEADRRQKLKMQLGIMD